MIFKQFVALVLGLSIASLSIIFSAKATVTCVQDQLNSVAHELASFPFTGNERSISVALLTRFQSASQRAAAKLDTSEDVIEFWAQLARQSYWPSTFTLSKDFLAHLAEKDLMGRVRGAMAYEALTVLSTLKSAQALQAIAIMIYDGHRSLDQTQSIMQLVEQILFEAQSETYAIDAIIHAERELIELGQNNRRARAFTGLFLLRLREIREMFLRRTRHCSPELFS